MSYVATFSGWDKLSRSDLLVAYRKAKSDVFFENSFPTAIKFAEYEKRLLRNLNDLLGKLRSTEGFANDESLSGEFRLVPKKLALTPKIDGPIGHCHHSDPEQAFESLLAKNNLQPGFRIVGDFPVETHILSALWINFVGHKIDACLDETAYGSRLRRIRSEDLSGGNTKRPFHITAIGSFEPYYEPYKRWRSDGLKAIKKELGEGREVIAISLDLRSFYHQIDPAFLDHETFLEELGLTGPSTLSDDEANFTGELSSFLCRWASYAQNFAASVAGQGIRIPGGLAIGLTASRLISNALLKKWDDLVQEKLTPIHYGRYVDDMFLVLQNPGNVSDMADLLAFMQDRLGETVFSKDAASGAWNIQLGQDYQSDSKVQLQPEKQKLFILKGTPGIDLIETIEKEIHELSSEYRLMPTPDQLEQTTAAKTLSAASSASESADNLRRADDLTIRRLSWSLQMRHVETLSNDLPKSAWKEQRGDFYRFAYDHVLRADKLFDHFSYLPRLLGFAVALDEWKQAESIVSRTFRALDVLEAATDDGNIEINGAISSSEGLVWNYIRSSTAWFFIDAAARYYNPINFAEEPRSKRVRRLARLFLEQRTNELRLAGDFSEVDFEADDFYEIAPLVAACDLARTPYKLLLEQRSASALFRTKNRPVSDRALQKAFTEIKLLDTAALSDFLKISKEKRLRMIPSKLASAELIRPYLFPTRPYTPLEIGELAPWSLGIGNPSGYAPAEEWARFVRSLRGVWVKPTLLEKSTEPKRRKKGLTKAPINIGTGSKSSVIVAITNLLTSDEMWAACATGNPILSLERYKRISELANQAIRLRPKPDYFLLPELSLPLAWVESLGSRLYQAGIGLIAGTEYEHRKGEKVISHACIQLEDDRLGFSTSVRIWQEKNRPAPDEEHQLLSRFGKIWACKPSNTKRVYVHNGFHFGVMVCSELQNTRLRVSFQGKIDALMICSWNKDLDTFSSLIEASALDIHAYIVQANNRLYGDSRARAPAKKSFQRDIARARGGENDFCVTVKLDTAALRAFQSREKRWPHPSHQFKPVPEGFKISTQRRFKPPS